MTKYNGWTNYETWAVKLWMDNDEGEYNYWKEYAIDKGRADLASVLKEYHEDQASEMFCLATGTLYHDLMTAALGSVNWYEIADTFLEELEDA